MAAGEGSVSFEGTQLTFSSSKSHNRIFEKKRRKKNPGAQVTF